MANQVLYGFRNLTNVFSDPVTSVGLASVNSAIDETLAEHNRQLDALTSLFADSTTDYKRRYKTPVAARLQPVDEHGRARPIRAVGFYDIAFPMHRGAAAWGTTYEASLKATVADANATMNTLLTADARWMRDHMLAALFVGTAWTYNDEERGALIVKGLANGDTDTYLIQEGTDSGSSDTHLFAQVAAIDNANDPFPTINTELMEHAENSGDVIALIPTGLKATIEGLAGFYPTTDNNIRYGSNVSVLDSTIGGNLPGRVFGYHSDGVWLVEWKSMPANYIVATTTGGDRPLSMRQDTVAQLVGFNRVAQRDDYPYYESQYLRKAGFGAQNRVGALVYQIGSASYAVPAGYESPMA